MKLNIELKPSLPKGFLLMESLLAFSIFGIAVTSIIIAVHKTSTVSYNISRETKTLSQLKSLFTEVLTIPVSEDDFERDEVIDLEDANARIQITPLEEVRANQDSNIEPLKQLYSVKITLKWDEEGVEKTKVAETTHYYPLYQAR